MRAGCPLLNRPAAILPEISIEVYHVTEMKQTEISELRPGQLHCWPHVLSDGFTFGRGGRL